MSDALDLFLQEAALVLETELERCIPVSSLQGSEKLNQAVCSALFPGGKRMRPLLTLLTTHAFSGAWRDALPVACAVEYFHTCSLILDDLPCMDGASERRGRRPTHLVFGESTAILASIALLNSAWTLLHQNGNSPESPDRARRLIEEASRCFGPDGIIGGQFFDLQNGKDFKGVPASFLKTASTTRFMLSSGAIMADASGSTVEVLALFGRELGAVYQMLDDIIDMDVDDRLDPEGLAAMLLDQACSRLNQAMDQVLQSLGNGPVPSILEFTRRTFRPMIERARAHLESRTSEIKEP